MRSAWRRNQIPAEELADLHEELGQDLPSSDAALDQSAQLLRKKGYTGEQVDDFLGPPSPPKPKDGP